MDNSQAKQTMFEMYPEDTAYVGTYNTYKWSGLLRDLIRVYGILNPFESDKLNKVISKELNISYKSEESEEDEEEDLDDIEFLMKKSNTFNKFLNNNKELRNDFLLLFGKIRNTGKHAGGIVISEKIHENMPINDVDGLPVTSLTEGVTTKDLSDMGFVKIDILGTTVLLVIGDCIKLIESKTKMSNEEIYNKINPDTINFSNENVFNKIFRNGNLCGIFQFKSAGMRGYLEQVKPKTIEDLIAQNALFRPGPMAVGAHLKYGKLRDGKEQPNYFDSEKVEKVLKSTFGLLIYQEQIDGLATEVGNFSRADAITLRKTLIKWQKLGEEGQKKVESMKIKFFEGAKENKLKPDSINELWNMAIQMAGYSFNRAHSCCYAIIAYQCAYIKYFFPREFYTSLLKNISVSEYGEVISEIKKNGYEILPPDINNSESEFAIKNDIIYFGLSNIKGVGEKASKVIIYEREKNGKFSDLEDFLNRKMDWRVVNTRVIQNLIKVGCFGNNELLLLQIYDETKNSKNKSTNRFSLMLEGDSEFKKLHEKYIDDKNFKKQFSAEERNAIEIEFFEANILYDSFSLKDRKEKIKAYENKVGTFDDGRDYICVEFIEYRECRDKNGNEMAFTEMIDISGNKKSGVIFSSSFVKNKGKIKNVYFIKADLNRSRGSYVINQYDEIDKIEVKNV
jgi:DNA polymerase-3 subunit alpha